MAKKKRTKNSLARHAAGGPSTPSAIVSQVRFTGPLPHPQVLAQYDQVVPNGAERVIAMAETQATHRRAMEAAALRYDAIEARLGQVFALIIVLAGLGVGAYVLLNATQLSEKIAGGVIGLAPLVTIATAFIHGRKKS